MAWLTIRPDMAMLDVDHNRLLANLRPYVEQVNRFLSKRLDVAKMVEVVNPNPYRNRAGEGMAH